jgi:hypothetical protein
VRAVSLSVPLALWQLAQWVGMQDLSFSVTYFGALVAREIVSGKTIPGRSAGVTMEGSTRTSSAFSLKIARLPSGQSIRAGSSRMAGSVDNLMAVKYCPAWLLPFQALKLQSSTTTSPIVRPRQ